MPFENRTAAGRELSQRLLPLKNDKPLVFVVSQGGIPVGLEVSKALEVPMDLVIMRRVVSPGAWIEADVPIDLLILNNSASRYLNLAEKQLHKASSAEVRAIEDVLAHFHGDRPLTDIRGRTVIVVDDGLMAGRQMQALLEHLATIGPRRLVLAMPAISHAAKTLLAPVVDDLVLVTPEPVADTLDTPRYMDNTLPDENEVSRFLWRPGAKRV